MYTKRLLNCLLFSRHINLLTIAFTTNLFCSINDHLLKLPHEIILKVVVKQGESNTWVEQLTEYLNAKEYAPEIQHYVLPCYRLLMTCKSFYCNQALKKSLHMTISQFPFLIQNILVLNHILKESHSSKLQLTEDSYIKDRNIEKYTSFFYSNLNKIITITTGTKQGTFSLSEFLIENMKLSYLRTTIRFGFHFNEINHILKNHFKILDHACTTSDLTLPLLGNPRKNIAEFIFDILSKDLTISKHIPQDTIPKEILEMYKKRYKLDAIPKNSPIPLTIFLSDEAFERLNSAAKSTKKSDLYNKKLLNSILPEIPELTILPELTEPTILPELPKQSRFAYLVKQILNTLSILFKKICFLISMIKDCLYNHI